MRYAALAGALLLGACGAGEAEPPKELAAFHMRGLQLGTTLEEAKAKDIVTRCNEFTNGVSCDLTEATVAGVFAKDTYVSFDKVKGLRSINAEFDPESFATVAMNLNEAYGHPCNVTSGTLQNAFGAQYEDYTYKWCFKEGALTLRKYANRIDTMELWYLPPEEFQQVEAKPMTPDDL